LAVGCAQAEGPEPTADAEDTGPADAEVDAELYAEADVGAERPASPPVVATTQVLAVDVSRSPVCGVPSESVLLTVDERPSEVEAGMVAATIRLIALEDGAVAGLEVEACRGPGQVGSGFVRRVSDTLAVVPVVCGEPCDHGNGYLVHDYRWAVVNTALGVVSPALFQDWDDGSDILAWDG